MKLSRLLLAVCWLVLCAAAAYAPISETPGKSVLPSDMDIPVREPLNRDPTRQVGAPSFGDAPTATPGLAPGASPEASPSVVASPSPTASAAPAPPAPPSAPPRVTKANPWMPLVMVIVLIAVFVFPARDIFKPK